MPFWNHNKIPDYSIGDPFVYSAEILAPDYSQEINLSHTKKKKLRQEWQNLFPKLDNLNYLYVGHPVTQEYFEALCQIPNLKGLWVKSSRITDFNPIGQLRMLQELNFMGSKRIQSLHGIQSLTELKYCVLSNFFGINSLLELEEILGIKSLHLFGDIHGKRLNIESLEPIARITSIEELALDIKSNIDVSPIYELPKLRKLIIPESYHNEMKGKLSRIVEVK